MLAAAGGLLALPVAGWWVIGGDADRAKSMALGGTGMQSLR